jgi:hypothetical protein
MESSVWQFIDKTDDEALVLCKLCKPPKNNKIKRSKNTSNMWSHLEHNHTEEYIKLKQPTEEKNDSKANPNQPKLTFPCLKFSDQQLHSIVAQTIVRDMQPFSIVEDAGFRNIFKNHSITTKCHIACFSQIILQKCTKKLFKLLLAFWIKQNTSPLQQIYGLHAVSIRTSPLQSIFFLLKA